MFITDVVESLLTVSSICIATSSHLPSSTDKFARQVITSWSVFSFFISSIICNTVITQLMVPYRSALVDSVEDIVRHGYCWGEPGYTNDSKRSIYFNLQVNSISINSFQPGLAQQGGGKCTALLC